MEKMLSIKRAYMSRHYTRCAEHGEQLLAEVQSDIHPLHLAYLNFYTALSHDTLAREATLKHRIARLRLAEKHYMAAIAALSPEPASPTSPVSIFSEETSWPGSHASNAGCFDPTSPASSTTSFHTDPDMEYSPKGLGHFRFPSPPRSTSPPAIFAKQPSHTLTPSRPQSPAENRLTPDTSSFTTMLCRHLKNVQDLQAQMHEPSSRVSLPSPRPSPTTVAERCSQWVEGDSGAMDMLRKERRARRWRPRFDPAETRRLCAEALDEMA